MWRSLTLNKAKPSAKKCTFFGYLDGIKDYKLSIEDGEVKTLISHDVTFRESELYKNTIKSDPKHTEGAICIESIGLEVELSDVEANSNDPNKEKQPRETKAPQNQQKQSHDQFKTKEEYTEN
ncbi:LOW QUALITY PROTEIN: hypothetical protein PanWU01x14_222350 [Parasponia andersonii]|uniref:Retroviral polymerase SH3-like domain-containing protein n=1 Tax=Parasponia andersonii TaxID=3476 RepID=A0A2P5BPI5_PARAD|nr:LOW QUALITY PROTEIN: hypothetical protein PanWU01x14_222350 [Parasponia andersonii]